MIPKERQEFARKVKWLIGLRLLVLIIFLGSAAFLQFKESLPFPIYSIYYLIGLTFFLSLVYAIILPRVRNLEGFAFIQIIGDLLLETGLVYITGGIDSFFTFLYLFSIFAAGMMVRRRKAMYVAAVSSILYGGLINAEFYGLIPRGGLYRFIGSIRQPGYTLFQVFINIVAFFLVAILSSHLSSRLEEIGRRLKEKSLDLLNLESLHREVVANIPSGLMTLDLKGKIASFNRAAEEITGYTFEEVKARDFRETVFNSIVEIHAFFQTLKVDPSSAFEASISTKEGRIIPLGISLSPLCSGNGELIGLIANFRDLTEKKRIEARLRQADRLAAVGQLAATIAHEIRNPLAAISGSIQVLKEDLRLSGEDQKLVEIILREADRLKLITGQFLDFARPQGDHPRQCELGELLEETVFLLEKSHAFHPESKVSLERPETPLFINADPDQLRQVFWNLGLNALQAMPNGGTLKISTRVASRQSDPHGIRQLSTVNREPSDDFVEISFTDTGGGVSTEDLERIFDPFFTTKDGGTGLGLSIARKIVRNMGGDIEVENRTGEGTTFRVLLRQTSNLRPQTTDNRPETSDNRRIE